jgi:extracellular factor (EF) 3-hydroxypalmitic acid methyl ester biosynthesis protein
MLLKLNRHLSIFEIYCPVQFLRISEVLQDLKIAFGSELVYAGKGVVRNVIHTSTMTVCEATLEEGWLDVDLSAITLKGSKLGEEFQQYLRQCQHPISVEFKSLMADMKDYLLDVQQWLEQIEFAIRGLPSSDRLKVEKDIAQELGVEIAPSIDALWSKFEPLAKTIEPESQPAYCSYLRRQLHPLLLCSPFAYRSFHKPLGYAGDYEAVNMIWRNPLEGSTLFAKLINLWLLQQPPAEAHRNRIRYLIQQLRQELMRIPSHGRPARVFSLGCGPAIEIQELLATEELSSNAHVTLLDFNEETLQHVSSTLAEIKNRCHRKTGIQLIKKSVQQILKESARTVQLPAEHLYDFIYCAGLFDYLSNSVCQRFVSILYEWLAPGGLLLVTNVDSSRPFHISMEYILEWRLICRNGMKVSELVPERVPQESVCVQTDLTGVNVFLQIRKPAHG